MLSSCGGGGSDPVVQLQKELETQPEYSIILNDMREEGNFVPSYYHQYRVDIGENKDIRPFQEVSEEVFKKYSNGEYDILVKGEEIFKVKGTEMDGDTVVGDVEFLPTQTGMEGPQFQKFQESYLKILLKFGVDRDLELHMKKKISFEFLQGLQLPLILKKEIINIKDEVNRLEFIKNIFNNILEADSKSPSGNLPQA